LVSVEGQVIGVNSAIASETGFYSGYGFAIPIDLARNVMDQIITSGRVHRSALGIMVQNATPNDAAYVGLSDVHGVLVQDFSPGSPAQKAGIQPGDIIISIDGKPVEYVGQLQQTVGFRKPGEKVKVEVARKGGVRKTYEIPLQEVPSRDLADRSNNAADSTADSSNDNTTSIDLLGLTVQPVDQDAIQQLQLSPAQRGLLVTDVQAGGPAYGEIADPDHGGPDIILEVEGKAVKTVADLRNSLKGYKPGDIVSLRLYNPQAKANRIERIRLGS
jgi:serine protease Do